MFAPRPPTRRCCWSFTISVFRNLFHFDFFKVIYFPLSTFNLWCIFAEQLFVFLSLLCHQIFLRSKRRFLSPSCDFFLPNGCFFSVVCLDLLDWSLTLKVSQVGVFFTSSYSFTNLIWKFGGVWSPNSWGIQTFPWHQSEVLSKDTYTFLYLLLFCLG